MAGEDRSVEGMAGDSSAQMLSLLQSLASDMKNVKLELDTLEASRGSPDGPGTNVPTLSPTQNVSVTAGLADRGEVRASDLPPDELERVAPPTWPPTAVAPDSKPAPEPKGWLPLLLPGDGVHMAVGENPYKRPPPGVSYDRPQLYGLHGDVGFDRMCRENMVHAQHEMTTLGPACFYLHNAIGILEDDSGEEFPRKHVLDTLREILALMSKRHSFLVLDAMERKSNPGLVQYLKVAMTGVGEGVPLASGDIREFADTYMKLTAAESAKHAAKAHAGRLHAADGSRVSGRSRDSSGRGSSRSQGVKTDNASASGSSNGSRKQS